MITFTEEILNEKRHFLCNEKVKCIFKQLSWSKQNHWNDCLKAHVSSYTVTNINLGKHSNLTMTFKLTGGSNDIKQLTIVTMLSLLNVWGSPGYVFVKTC